MNALDSVTMAKIALEVLAPYYVQILGILLGLLGIWLKTRNPKLAQAYNEVVGAVVPKEERDAMMRVENAVVSREEKKDQ
jgi:hypothetical protein